MSILQPSILESFQINPDKGVERLFVRPSYYLLTSLVNFGTIARVLDPLSCALCRSLLIGGFVVQRLFALTILVISILWIVISYLPGVQSLLPTIAFTYGNGWLASLAVLALVCFIAIQLWLVYTTVNTVRDVQAKHSRPQFPLKVGTELFWTALPIAMTLALAWASYALWLNIASR